MRHSLFAIMTSKATQHARLKRTVKSDTSEMRMKKIQKVYAIKVMVQSGEARMHGETSGKFGCSRIVGSTPVHEFAQSFSVPSCVVYGGNSPPSCPILLGSTMLRLVDFKARLDETRPSPRFICILFLSQKFVFVLQTSLLWLDK
jgi:hypothetical protein